MKWAQPSERIRTGGPTSWRNPRRFASEAAELWKHPGRWADLEVPEQGRALYTLADNVRRGRLTEFPVGEFDARVENGKLFVRKKS